MQHPGFTLAMNRIPQYFIDDVLNRLDIVDVVDSRVKLKKAGKDYVACCPFHKEKTPSFSVSQDKQFYYCFGCGASGTALGFVMEYDRLGFVEAVEHLSKSLGLEVPLDRAPNPAHDNQKALCGILEKARAYYEEQLHEHPQRKTARSYLRDRGLNSRIIKTFGVGYAPPGWDNLLNRLGLNEQDRQLLITSGMVIHNEDNQRQYDRFRHRIMFPIIDSRGRTIGFGGRILDSGGDDTGNRNAGPKYLNSPETPVFQKGRELYGLYQARQASSKLQRLIVVEGYMDVIALAQYDITCAVATLGTACGAEHLQLAFKHTSEVVFCFDGDNAGRRAARRALENALPVMTDGRQIRFLFLPEGQDPDSLVRQIGTERFEQQLTQAMPLEDFFFEAVADSIDLRAMDGRARMSKLAAPLLHRLPTGVYRELMFDQLARRTGLSTDTLYELIDAPASLEPPPPANNNNHSLTPSTESAPVRTPEPEQFKLPEAARRTLFTPIRIATSLLLEQPELIASDIDFTLPDDPDSADLQQLRQLIALLQSRRATSFHSILGYWGGQYGMEAQRQLTELVANQFFGSAIKSTSYNSGKELQDALKRIRTEDELRNHERELAQLSNLTELTGEQKQRLRQLLAAKAQTKLNALIH